MSPVKATERNPATPGYYVMWPAFSRVPIVTYWSGCDGKWRRGAQVIKAAWWLGPLPECSL